MIRFSDILIDMTVMDGGKMQTIVILDNDGHIWYDFLESIQMGVMKKIRDYHDETMCSIYFSKHQCSLFTGHINKECYEFEVRCFDLSRVNVQHRKTVQVHIYLLIIKVLELDMILQKSEVLVYKSAQVPLFRGPAVGCLGGR